MKRCMLLVVAVGFVVAGSVGPAGAADGWSMPTLNPFAKKKPAGPVKARTSDASWKMPSLWPKSLTTTTTVRPAPKAPAGPTTWQKMTSSTKSAVSKTADFLNPFNDATDNEPAPSPTGSNTAFSQAMNKKTPADDNSSSVPDWLWGGSEKEAQRPKTVNEFLAQPKPQF